MEKEQGHSINKKQNGLGQSNNEKSSTLPRLIIERKTFDSYELFITNIYSMIIGTAENAAALGTTLRTLAN